MIEQLNWSRYKNFTEAEFRCKCGCGRADMKEDFMDSLQGMRGATGRSFIVTSGYRCPDYNDRIAKTGRTGPHTTGRAVDLLCSGEAAHEILGLAMEAGMTGVGVSQRGDHGGRFLHLDDLITGPRPGLWSY